MITVIEHLIGPRICLGALLLLLGGLAWHFVPRLTLSITLDGLGEDLVLLRSQGVSVYLVAAAYRPESTAPAHVLQVVVVLGGSREHCRAWVVLGEAPVACTIRVNACR